MVVGPFPSALTVRDYRSHPLHDQQQVWAERNCYVDLWVELLHSLDVDPVAGLAFTLGADFEGDQWSFSKYPAEDLRLVYGVAVAELNVWRPVLHHVVDHMALGELLTVEVDSYYLPDTDGLAYRSTHTKTTITPGRVDVACRRMEYFHNAGYFELADDDFDGIFGVGQHTPPVMAPYVESVRLDSLRRDPPAVLAATADALLTQYLERRPAGNPAARWAEHVGGDLEWLASDGSEQFHAYTFSMCRQFGASAELAAAFVGWLADQGRGGESALRASAAHLQACAESSKSLQFALARLSRGRRVDVSSLLARIVDDWANAVSVLVERSIDQRG